MKRCWPTRSARCYGKIVAIDAIADPLRLAELLLAVLAG